MTSAVDSRGFLLLVLTIVAGLVGCSASEVRLWPLLDVERPAGAESGVHAEVLWPLVEVDTTDDVEFAVRPLLSYDSGAGKGSFLWPLGWFDVDNPLFSFWPLYSWAQWDEEKRSGHHFFLPLGGYRQKRDARSWWFGPGLFGRFGQGEDGVVHAGLIPPFASYSNESDTERTIGGLVPPFYYHRENDERSLLLVNYYRHRSDQQSSDVFFPLLWSRDRAVGERQESHREFFPLLGWTRAVDASHEEPVRKTRVRALWPLSSVEWGPEAGASQLLMLAGWRREGGEVVSHRVLPFYATGLNYSAVPLLGFGRWDWRTDDRVGRRAHGWVAWPFIRHQQHSHRAETTESWVQQHDAWEFVAGLVGKTTQFDEGGAEVGYGHRVWPIYDYNTTTEGHEFPASRLAMFAGTLRSVSSTDYRQFGFPYPFGNYERSGESTSHRLWPLYRYRSRPSTDPGAEAGGRNVEFTALVELISVRRGVDISEGPGVLLRPFTYQETGLGDYELRLFWKLFESGQRGDESRWGLHPLFYTRSSEKRSAWFLLGGLLGRLHDSRGSRTRLLWFFDL